MSEPKPGETGHCGPSRERMMEAHRRGEVLGSWPRCPECQAAEDAFWSEHGDKFIVPPASSAGGSPEAAAACDRLTAWLRATHDGSCRICGRGNDFVDQHADDCEAAPVIAAALAQPAPSPGPLVDELTELLEELEVTVNGGGDDSEGTTQEVAEVAERLVEAWLTAADRRSGE